jgi:hypothetical protein
VEEPRMKKAELNRRKYWLKLTALAVTTIFLIASTPMIIGIPIPSTGAFFNSDSQQKPESSQVYQTQTDSKLADAIPSANGQFWEDMSTGSTPGTPPQTFVSDSNMTGITVASNINGFWRGNVSLNGTWYDSIDLPAATPRVAQGEPAVPRLTFNLEIPHDVEITTMMLSANLKILPGYNVVPAQVPTIGLNGAAPYPFIKNTTLYSTSSTYPDYNFTTAGHLSSARIVLRGRRLLQVSMYPVQFIPGSGQLIGYTQFEIRFNFDHSSEIEAVDESLYSEEFESLYARFILNYVPWTALPSPSTSIIPTSSSNSFNAFDENSRHEFITSEYPSANEAKYLIIAYDDFAYHAQRLASWKTRKGVYTRVVRTSQIYDWAGVNSGEVFEYTHAKTTHEARIQSIKDFIQAEVITMNPVPTYILLFGDINHIPCDYSIRHTARFLSEDPGVIPPYYYHGEGDKGLIPTDVTYFCFEEDDYLPDIMHGRLSVENNDQARYVVDKILAYEQQPGADIHEIFYQDILLSSYFDDYRDPTQSVREIHSDGVEDEPFISTMEFIYNELSTQYTFHKCYNYSTDDYPEYLFDSSEVSSIAWHADDPPSFSADHEDIIENIFEGRFLVYHFDHGSSVNFYWNDMWMEGDNAPPGRGEFDGWGAPDFRTDQFGLLKYIDESDFGKYPLVLSMACMTGWFDGETDGLYDEELSDTGYDGIHPYDAGRLTDSFAEEIVRIENGGAIAAIAPTRINYNRMSANLMLGITNAIWPGTIDAHYGPEYVPPLFNLGLALYCGKFHVNDAYAFDAADTNQTGNITILEYQLFGDPETPLWTGTPQILTAEHPRFLWFGEPYTIEVIVENLLGERVDGAKVCLHKEGEILEIEDTINGMASFDIELPTCGRLQVTVTKQNCIPYIDYIQVCPICIVLLVIIVFPPILIVIIIFIKKRK